MVRLLYWINRLLGLSLSFFDLLALVGLRCKGHTCHILSRLIAVTLAERELYVRTLNRAER